MPRRSRRFPDDRAGATAVECGIVGGLLATVIVAAMAALGVALLPLFDHLDVLSIFKV